MYNVVETTNLYGSKCIDMQATIDIENGYVVKKGDLLPGEQSIYAADIPEATDRVYLVAHPAWSYNDNSATDQNEENFINKKGVPFRTYELAKDRKFKIMDYGITPINKNTTPVAVGQFVVVDGTSNKLKAVAEVPADAAFVGKVVFTEEIGFPYCVGSYGTPITIGAEGMGYSVDTRVKKVTIEVIKNA